MKRLVWVLVVIMLLLSGCMSQNLLVSNYKFDQEGRPLSIQKQSVKSKIYSHQNSRYYKVNFKEESIYLKVTRNQQMSLEDSAPEEKRLIGETTIHVVDNDSFNKKLIESNELRLPKEVYVVVGKDGNISPSKCNYTIYYSTYNILHERNMIKNNLSQTTTHQIQSALRNSGYLITVPLDIISLPLMAILMN